MVNMRWTKAAALLSILPSALAQTHTDCDPTKVDCPPNQALGTIANFEWNGTAADNKIWNTTNGEISWASDGAEFSVLHQKDSPTIQSLFYMFWGRVSVIMKAAAGDGIVSSVVLESIDLDEIDWEWLGGNTTHVQTNFYGKGDDTDSAKRSFWFPVDNTLNEHNYTTVWTAQQIEWYIDDKQVRTLKYEDPLAKNATTGDRYPQTPMNIRIGNWAGGDPETNGNGTVQWAMQGKPGSVDYSKGPYIQTVMAVEAHDYTSGKEYSYGDRSGTWQSIKVATGNSTIADRLAHPQGLTNKFNALPAAVKAGVGIGAASVAGILVVLLGFCCIRNRRAGKKEKAVADAMWEANLQELQRYKRAMVAEEEIHPRAGYI